MATWLIGAGALSISLLIVTVLGRAVLTAITKPFADEIGYQIDRFPERLFFIALMFFPEGERERRFDQWAEDYQDLSDKYEKRTLVRVYKCTRFCLSLLTCSGFISRGHVRRLKRRQVDAEVILLDDGRHFEVHGRIGGIIMTAKTDVETTYFVGGEAFKNHDDALKHAANMAFQKYRQQPER